MFKLQNVNLLFFLSLFWAFGYSSDTHSYDYLR